MIEFNGKLLRKLIDQQYINGIEGLLTAWQNKYGEESTPNKSTIYRWLNGQLPRSEKEVLTLCSILDIDPFCTLTAHEDKTISAIEHLLTSFQMDYWRKPSLRFLQPFLGRQIEWPLGQIARDYFQNNWIVRYFKHDADRQQNYYGLIELYGDPSVYQTRPQVFHVAFKQPGYFRDRWLEYGIVERFDKTVRLIHINGHNDESMCEDQQEATQFETWFGPSSLVFGVASLHEFKLEKAGELNNKGRVVRFPA